MNISNIVFKTIIIYLLCFTSQFSFSQENQKKKPKKYQVGIQGNFLIAGNYNVDYGLLLGAEFQYYFAHKSKFHHFLNTGFHTDLGSEGTNLYIFNAGIGTEYEMFPVFGKPLSVYAHAGGAFIQEKFSNQVIGNVIETSDNSFVFMAELGFSYPISNRFAVQLSASQFGRDGTSAGIGIHYSF
jgi:hypothetical protein